MVLVGALGKSPGKLPLSAFCVDAYRNRIELAHLGLGQDGCILSASRIHGDQTQEREREGAKAEKTLRAYGNEHSHFTQALPFHIVAHSLAHAKTQLFSFQPLAHSLSQNTGVGIPSRSSARSPLHARVLLLARIGLAPPHFRQTLVLR